MLWCSSMCAGLTSMGRTRDPGRSVRNSRTSAALAPPRRAHRRGSAWGVLSRSGSSGANRRRQSSSTKGWSVAWSSSDHFALVWPRRVKDRFVGAMRELHARLSGMGGGRQEGDHPQPGCVGSRGRSWSRRTRRKPSGSWKPRVSRRATRVCRRRLCAREGQGKTILSWTPQRLRGSERWQQQQISRGSTESTSNWRRKPHAEIFRGRGHRGLARLRGSGEICSNSRGRPGS